MPRIRFRRFDRGLWVNGPAEASPEGSLRRGRGARGVRSPTLRVRPGSTVAIAGLPAAHSLYRFMGARFAGVGTLVYREGASIGSGLNGQRLAFATMPPTVGKPDYLYITGGMTPFKVDAGGSTSNWGIGPAGAAPNVFDNVPGVLSAGTYQYRVTFKNTITGHRGNPSPTTTPVTLAANRSTAIGVNPPKIPVSSDPQVNARELWRTVANGNVFFFLAEIPDNVTLSYLDDIPDAGLGSEILPIDNEHPEREYADVAGPWNRRLWWTRDSRVGMRGRLYFSPVARPESVEDFIDISSDDDPCQKALVWNGFLWVLTQKRLLQILGDPAGPFTWRQIEGVPGTRQPFAVKGTPYGILYPSSDHAIVAFDGAKSERIGFDALEPLWHREAAENLTPWEPIIADFHDQEYIASDGVQTLAFDAIKGTWRDLGLAVSALYAEKDTGLLLGGLPTAVALLDDESATTDLGAPIVFDVQPPSGYVDSHIPGTVQRVYIEAWTQGQALTPTLFLDGQEITLPPFDTTVRRTVEYAIARPALVFGVRLTGSLTLDCEVYGIEVDLYLPDPGSSTAQVRAAAGLSG